MRHLLICITFSILFIASACKKEEVKDERLKFIGEYEGNLECMANLAPLINGMTTFVIAETSSAEDKVDITINSNPVIRLEAVINGNKLEIDNLINGITILTGNYDLKAKGTLTLSNDEQMVNGPLAITLTPTGFGSPIEDSCDINGTKK